MKTGYWNTVGGHWHGLSVNGLQLVCPLKHEHKIPDECEQGEQFTVRFAEKALRAAGLWVEVK